LVLFEYRLFGFYVRRFKGKICGKKIRTVVILYEGFMRKNKKMDFVIK
jgi:hypothetical protein